MLSKNNNLLISIIIILVFGIIISVVYVKSKTLGEYEIGVFGISLGADHDFQSKVAMDNNICDHNISGVSKDICCYTVFPPDFDGEVLGRPYIYWDNYEPNKIVKFFTSEVKKKIASRLEIAMFDDISYPIIGDSVMSAVSSYQMEKIKQAYIQKYGSPSENGRFFNWTLENGVEVSLEIQQNDFSVYEKFKPSLSYFRNSYSVIARYDLPKSKRELLTPVAKLVTKI